MATKKKTAVTAKGYVDIIKSGYHVRTAPNKKAESVAVTKDGDILAWTGKNNNGWVGVLYCGVPAWIASRAVIVHEVEQNNLFAVIDCKDKIDVHAQPKKASDVVGELSDGYSVLVIDAVSSKTWTRVLYGDLVGWVSKKNIG